MSDHAFYAAMLRFVVRKAFDGQSPDQRMTAMMGALDRAAVQAETGHTLYVKAANVEITARAFAGVAAFLQKQILPEVVTAGNQAGEAQVRWAVDVSMAAVSTLLSRAALQDGTGDVDISLPAAP